MASHDGDPTQIHPDTFKKAISDSYADFRNMLRRASQDDLRESFA